MGGRTPEHLYRALVQLKDFPWDKTHLYLNDERFVPHDSTESNMYTLSQSGLLTLVPATHVHAVPILSTPEESAAAYAQTLQSFASEGRLDCVLLGAGEDGHCASLFPGRMSEDVGNSSTVFAVKNSPKPPSVRVTLSYEYFLSARNIIGLVCGVGKQDAYKMIIGSPEKTPIGYIASHSEHAQLFADTDATTHP
jgi:6-phosphogluconolactonase